MSKILHAIFILSLLLVNIYANGVPNLIDNNSSIDPLDKDRVNNQDTFISSTIQRADVSRDKLILQGDNLYIGWDLKEGKEIWRNIGNKTQCSDCLPYPELLMLHNEDRAFIRPSYTGGSGVFFGVLMSAILEFDTNTGLFKVVNLKNSGILRKSHDDTKLLIDNEDGTIKIFDLQTLQLIAEYTGGKGLWHWGLRYQPQVFMTPDGKKVFQRGEAMHDNINCIDLDKNTSYSVIGNIEGSYGSQLKGITHDGKIVFLTGVVNRENRLIAYDLNEERILYDLNFSFSKIRNIFISENDVNLYVLDDDNNLKIIVVSDGRIVSTVKLNGVKTIQPIEHSRYLSSLDHGILQILDANFKPVALLQSMVDGEWVIITNEGYFNASSKLALSNLYISEHSDTRLLKDDEIKKYYRPDIVSTILQQKSITELETKQLEFALPEKGAYVNQYYPSLRAMYVKDKNPYGLVMLAQEKNPNDFKLIKKAILDTNDTEVKLALYRSFVNFDQSITLSFIIEQLQKFSSNADQVSLLNQIKDMDVRLEQVQSLLDKKELTDDAKVWIARTLREQDCQKFEVLLWEAIQKEPTLRNDAVLNYLIQQDSKRLELIWTSYTLKVLSNQGQLETMSLSRLIPYFYKVNPKKTIDLLINSQYPFSTYLASKIKDPALINPLLENLIENDKIDSTAFTALIKYQDVSVNQRMVAKIRALDCKKISNSMKIKIEQQLHINFSCDKH